MDDMATIKHGRELRAIQAECSWFGVKVIPHNDSPDRPEQWVFVDVATDQPILIYDPDEREAVFIDRGESRRIAPSDLIGLVVRVRGGLPAVVQYGPDSRRSAFSLCERV